MTMPFRPVRVVGGLRLWLATIFTDWVREASERRLDRWPAVMGRRPAAALTASVIDGAILSTLPSCLFAAVARPERLVERGDFPCRRAISLGLRNTAPGFEPLTERHQLADTFGADLQLETARRAQALLD